MSNFQYRSIMSVAWLSVCLSTENVWFVGSSLVFVTAYSIGAVVSKYKEPV